MARWISPTPVDVPAPLRDAVGGHPLVAETLVRRGVCAPAAAQAFLDPSVYQPAPAADLPGLAMAADRLRSAIKAGERIAIWGDFDADGQTATALLLETLRSCGADVTFYVPSRNEGHGLHERALDRLIGEGARLILTCDTGTTAHAAVTHAVAQGAEVVITDHHVPGAELPPAQIVVNPHQLPPGHPMAGLTGVGVAYEVAAAMAPEAAARALDLVAIGVVADVADLVGDTRYVVQRGLQALRHTVRPGLRSMLEAANLRAEGITEEHVGFVIAPRLNAIGRLADAARGVELLTTLDLVQARILARDVEGLNSRRQWLTKQVTEAALSQIERQPALLTDHAALVLSHPTWPVGVIGIVAGRLAERFHKPVFLVTTAPGQLGWGSGRSVPGVDLMAVLAECSPLLESFGGHTAAAGVNLQPERVADFRAAFSRAVGKLSPTLTEPDLIIDAYVELPDFNLNLVSELTRLAPFGPGNPPPTLAVRDVALVSDVTLGRTAEHCRLTIQDSQDRALTVFWWQGAGLPRPSGRFDLALSIRATDYRGAIELQAEWIGARELAPVVIEEAPPAAIAVVDFRTAGDPKAQLATVLAQGSLQVWAEGDTPAALPARNRLQLVRGPRLAVWTLPPGPNELAQALSVTQPEVVYLFAHDPGLDARQSFLNRLGGLARFALNRKGGVADLEAMAAATAHRISTVQAGLEWLEARGQLAIAERQSTVWSLVAGPFEPNAIVSDAIWESLASLLAEAAAYRRYLRLAPASAWLGRPDASSFR